MGALMSVVPFRLPEPLAIVTLDGGNWRVEAFDFGNVTSPRVWVFSTTDQAGDHVADLFIEGSRLLFKEWTSGVLSRMCEALQ